jgi:proteasome assembly chaperone (PAC2) family protein
MMQKKKLNDPILIAAWPGMGHVAVTACYYLIAKLGMEFRAEYLTNDLFDVDHVAIESGVVQPFRYPKNQFFVWRNPEGGNDLLVFIGEAQPPNGQYNFCRKLIDYVQSEGVTKVFTFASLATAIQLEDDSRVIGAATDTETLHQLIGNDVGLLNNGSISGMNGILLGVAAERKLPGGCLLGEIPQIFAGVPYPKASLAVLNAFSQITGIPIDTSEMNIEVDKMQQHLSDVISQFRRLEQEGKPEETDAEETYLPDPMENGKLSDEEKQRLEELFEEAQKDRTSAYELKRELDRLDVFAEYEDRFLDLFKTDDD